MLKSIGSWSNGYGVGLASQRSMVQIQTNPRNFIMTWIQLNFKVQRRKPLSDGRQNVNNADDNNSNFVDVNSKQEQDEISPQRLLHIPISVFFNTRRFFVRDSSGFFYQVTII